VLHGITHPQKADTASRDCCRHIFTNCTNFTDFACHKLPTSHIIPITNLFFYPRSTWLRDHRVPRLGTTPTWSLSLLRRARINGCLQQINIQYISFSFCPMLLGRMWLLAELDRHRDMSFRKL
jgi:hypothetical protein